MRATCVSPLRVVFWFIILALSFNVSFGLLLAPQQLYAEENGPDAPGSISGVVRNAAGEPLPDIDVYLYQSIYYSDSWSWMRPFKTDAAGRYRFSVLPSGIYRVGASDASATYATSFYPAAHSVYDAADLVVNGNQRTGIDLTLAVSGQIVGTILAVDGITLTNKGVELYQPSALPPYLGNEWSSWQQVHSQYFIDDQDQFRFDGLTAGRYRICAGGSNSSTLWRECYDNVYDVNIAQDLTVTAGAVVSDVVIVLGDGADYATLQGKITSPQDVPLAEVGVYVIQAEAVSYQPLFGLSLAPAMNPAQGPSATLPTYPSNIPYSYYTATDAEGNYQIRNLPAGNYQLLFYDLQGRYRYEYYDNTLARNASTTMTITKREVITGIDAQLTIGAHIKGTLTLLGQPAPSAYVTVYKKTGTAWEYIADTPSEPITGSYDVGGLPAGVYRLSASAWTNSPINNFPYYAFYGGDALETAADITLNEAATQSKINISLGNGPQFNGAMSGQVTADGKPLANARVSLYSSLYANCCDPLQTGPAQIYAITDKDGRYKIEGLTDQSFYVRFDDPGGDHGSLFYPGEPRLLYGNSVTTNDSETTTGIDIDLTAGGKIKGQIYQLNGADLSTLTVLAILTESPQSLFIFREMPVSADGTYLLTGLAPGTYHVCAGAKYYDNYLGLDCYGGAGINQWFNSGIPLTVEAGKTVDAIDILWGPDYEQYLPVVAK